MVVISTAVEPARIIAHGVIDADRKNAYFLSDLKHTNSSTNCLVHDAANKLSLNATKTKFIVFSMPQN